MSQFSQTQKQQSSCTCTYSGRVGRMCSGCAPMQVRGTFTDIHGKTNVAEATLGCDGTMHAVWQGPVTCTFVALFKSGTCNTQGRVMCERTSDGNLIAKVEEDACSMEDFVEDDIGDEDTKNATVAYFRRRQLSEPHHREDGGGRRRLLNLRGSSGVFAKDSGEKTILKHKKNPRGCFDSFTSQSGAVSSVTGSSAKTSYTADKRSQPMCSPSLKKIKECTVTAKCEFV